MGFNFRKSIKLGKNFRVNLSKSSVGLSAGVKGARVSVGPKGIRKTACIPGTGISYTEQKSWNQINKSVGTKNSDGGHVRTKSIPTTKKGKKSGCGCFTIILVIIVAIIGLSHPSNTSKNVSSNSTSTSVETKPVNNTTEVKKDNSTVTPPTSQTNNANEVSNTPASTVNQSTDQSQQAQQNNGIQPNTQQVQDNSINQNSNSDDNTIVYYVPGSKVYHLSKSDGTLRKSKNIQSMTLKEAKANGMRQSGSKADQ